MPTPKLYDLTPPITTSLAVWPGDTRPSREILLEIESGASVTLSTLHATVHLGAHADGPNHYGAGAQSIDQRMLDYYLGRCQVIHVSATRGRRIQAGEIKATIDAPRILLATGTYPDSERFNEDFAALSPELIDSLHSKGVITIGVDTPSVDLFDSKDLPAHKAFLRNDMAILEGLVLNAVPEGFYELIALPLRLVGFDASPIRAILRSLDAR